MLYAYSFFLSVVGGSQLEASREFTELLSLLCYRIVAIKSEEEFREFRAKLRSIGIELVEIERVLYNSPESVM